MNDNNLIYPEFDLTDEMINQIQSEIIPNLKSWYNVTSNEEYAAANEEGKIDNVDLFQYVDCHFPADEILKINRAEFESLNDYLEVRECRWEETFEIPEKQHIINLGMDYLDETIW